MAYYQATWAWLLANRPPKIVVAAPAAPAFSFQTGAISYSTVAALKLETNLVNNVSAFVLGLNAAFDGQGGVYCFQAASAAADNGTTVIQPATLPPTGRWLKFI